MLPIKHKFFLVLYHTYEVNFGILVIKNPAISIEYPESLTDTTNRSAEGNRRRIGKPDSLADNSSYAPAIR
jgi:hypothetical protein